MNHKLSVTLVLLLASQTAAAAEVVPDGADGYRIMLVGKTGFRSSGTLQRRAYEQAAAHCASKSLVMESISMESKQARPFGGWPEATLRFKCVGPLPSVVAPSDEAAPVKDRYARLERLKGLLDSGALTQAEFDSEKTKILNP